MIVDCHTHIGCVGADSFDLSEHLDAAEVVDRCVVLATAGGASEEVNKHLSEYVGRYEQKMVGFGFVDPLNDAVSVRNLKGATEKLGLKGVVLYCSEGGFHPAHTRAMRLYESAEELGLPVFFHNSPVGRGGILEYAQPFLLDEVARAFAGLKIVVGNMGLPFYEQTLCLVGKQENVYADLSMKPGNAWQVYNVVAAAYEQGVTDKLLFGSGFPSARAAQCMETLLGINRLLGEANLPGVPRGNMQSIIERETLKLLGIEK